MKYIWSPSRSKYVLSRERPVGCVFCNSLQIQDGEENLILYRGKLAYIIMNRYPYTSGHIMVIPYVHQPSFENLDLATMTEIMELATCAMRVVRAEYQPEGFNLGANIGAAAGAGIAEHVHLHIVPRWAGDTNFITTLSQTRVLPEDINDSYQRLYRAWQRIFPDTQNC